MRINPTKSPTDPHRQTSHSHNVIFLWEGNHSYYGLAVLLVESDFSKLSMLDFDELMNWHGDTSLGRGPAENLTDSCQKAKDLLWAFI